VLEQEFFQKIKLDLELPSLLEAKVATLSVLSSLRLSLSKSDRFASTDKWPLSMVLLWEGPCLSAVCHKSKQGPLEPEELLKRVAIENGIDLTQAQIFIQTVVSDFYDFLPQTEIQELRLALEQTLEEIN
jgi:uncharacterized protein (DUF2267 family)